MFCFGFWASRLKHQLDLWYELRVFQQNRLDSTTFARGNGDACDAYSQFESFSVPPNLCSARVSTCFNRLFSEIVSYFVVATERLRLPPVSSQFLRCLCSLFWEHTGRTVWRMRTNKLESELIQTVGMIHSRCFRHAVPTGFLALHSFDGIWCDVWCKSTSQVDMSEA